jgi:hypothetical protein
MTSKRLWALLVGLVAVVGIYAGTVSATPSSGFTSTTLSKGRFYPINLSTYGPDGPFRASWGLIAKSKGLSDLYVQSNVWTPGGTSGWHTHPGPSLITVTAGSVTVYEGDDPSCTPHVYSAGEGFVDYGGDHVHLIRNEGTVDAKSITVQLIPADATRRIDAPDPGNCHF